MNMRLGHKKVLCFLLCTIPVWGKWGGASSHAVGTFKQLDGEVYVGRS